MKKHYKDKTSCPKRSLRKLQINLIVTLYIVPRIRKGLIIIITRDNGKAQQSASRSLSLQRRERGGEASLPEALAPREREREREGERGRLLLLAGRATPATPCTDSRRPCPVCGDDGHVPPPENRRPSNTASSLDVATRRGLSRPRGSVIAVTRRRRTRKSPTDKMCHGTRSSDISPSPSPSLQWLGLPLSLSLTCAYLLVRHSPSYPSHGCPPRVRAYPGRRGRAGDQGRKKADRVLGRRRCGDQRVGDVARRPTSRRPIRANATRLHPRAQKMALRCSTQQQQQRQQKQQRRVQYARSFARSLVSSLAPSLRRHSAGAAARLHRTPSGGATIARGAAKFQNRTRRLSSSFHCKCKLFPPGVINVRKIGVQSLYLFTCFFILFSIVYFSL